MTNSYNFGVFIKQIVMSKLLMSYLYLSIVVILSVFDWNEYYFVFYWSLTILSICFLRDSNVLLNVPKHVLHVVLVEIMIVLRVVVC